MRTGPAFGAVRMRDAGAGTSVLVGPRERDGGGASGTQADRLTVLVQTRHADAVRPGRTLAYRLSVYAGAPLGAGLVVLAIAAVWATLRRRA